MRRTTPFPRQLHAPQPLGPGLRLHPPVSSPDTSTRGAARLPPPQPPRPGPTPLAAPRSLPAGALAAAVTAGTARAAPRAPSEGPGLGVGGDRFGALLEGSES